MRFFVTFLSLLLISSQAYASIATSRYGMVSSQEKIATEVGVAILENGGNAIDAAVAVGFALSVTYPRAGNLGGGGFMMIHHAGRGETNAIDYRETAPAASYASMFLNVDGSVDNRRKQHGYKSTGVPGTVKGLEMAWKIYGQKPWEELVQPAIDLAEKGFPVYLDLTTSLEKHRDRLFKNKAARELFFPNGKPLFLNETFVQPDLAYTLTLIRDKKAAGFYQGETAQKIVDTMKHHHGLITKNDLISYTPRLREPLSFYYQDYKISTMPPPSAGGIALNQIFNMLEHLPVPSDTHDPDFYHIVAEMLRRAFADRAVYASDSDYEKVPLDTLTSYIYNRRQALGIAEKATTPSELVKPGAHMPQRESLETTHFTIMDKWGNVVSNTYTLNFPYGNGKIVPGAGFLLNNEMDDFSAKVGAQNAYGLSGGEKNLPEPGKRPVSSMMPTIVFDASNTAVLATGAPGGSRIVSAVVQLLIRTLVFGEKLYDATMAPRIHHQWLPDEMLVEKDLPRHIRYVLKQYGHTLRNVDSIAKLQSVAFDGKHYIGVADRRVTSAYALGPKEIDEIK